MNPLGENGGDNGAAEKRTIVVVNISEISAGYLASLTQNFGYQYRFIGANTPNEAVQLRDSIRPALILMDADERMGFSHLDPRLVTFDTLTMNTHSQVLDIDLESIQQQIKGADYWEAHLPSA